jgi:phospholipid N-methyltransferase
LLHRTIATYAVVDQRRQASFKQEARNDTHVQDANFAITTSPFALAVEQLESHREGAFQASSPKTFQAGLRTGLFFALQQGEGLVDLSDEPVVPPRVNDALRHGACNQMTILRRHADNDNGRNRMATVQLKKLQKAHGPVARALRTLRPWATFFRQFVKHPAMIGSIIPSSNALVQSMLAPVDWSTTRLFVEYGPGVGTFTRPILEKMRPDAMLVAIDTNADFVRYLNGDIADHRFRAVHGSAVDVRSIIAEYGFSEADYILSGLPFSTLPEGVGPQIAEETHAALRPGGTFLVYQYSRFVQAVLSPSFSKIDTALEWINIPPCRMFWATKEAPLAQAA